MNWFLIALIAPVLWSLTNHIDKHLISRHFKGEEVGALMIFSAAVGLFILPIIYLIQPSAISIKSSLAVLIVINGILYVVSMLPYFYAMQKDEASVVVPLYQLIPVFSYFLGLIFLKEVLTFQQVLASLLIIIGSVAMSIDSTGSKSKFKHQVFWLMFLSSFLVALNGLIFKFVAVQEDFWTTSFWEYIGLSIASIFLLLFISSYRKQFILILKTNTFSILSINAVNEVLNILAKISMNFATILAPLALAWVANGFQPFFVLFFGILITVFFPKFNQETLDKKLIFQKLISIVIMFIGVMLLS